MINEWVTSLGGRTTIRFTDSPGLTELRKAVILMVTVHCGEKIQMQISKRQSPGETRHELQMSCGQHFILPIMTHGNMLGGSPTREAH